MYAADTPERNALRDFGTTMRERGWKVRGLVQEVARDEKGEKIGLDAIDVSTGEHLPLARPSKEDREAGTCGFDVGLLAETTAVLRTAVEEKADLLIIEKFGEREQDGRGLAEEIVTAAMSGIPTLIAVPASALETWNEFTGRLGNLLCHDTESLWEWWPKWNLYKELALGVEDVPAVRIEVGENSILVEGPKGCGVTANPTKQAQAYPCDNISLRDLAFLTHNREDLLQHALGVAAILAHHNAYDMEGLDHSGLSQFEGRDDSVLIVGGFPASKPYSNNPTLIGLERALPHLMENAYDGVILPSHTFGDGLLPTLLDAKGRAETVIVGPETPLDKRLFDYGVDVLSGRIIEDADKAVEIVRNGGSPKDLKPVSRYITLEKE